jgi:ribosomal protein S4
MLKMFCLKYKFKLKFVRHFFIKKQLPFIYSTAITKKKRRLLYNRPYIKSLHDLLKFRIYYGDMTIKKFRKYLQRINKRRIDFISKVCFLLESRLDILLYRLNFVRNPREARKYIKLKKIKVNNKIISKLNHQVYINDIIYMNHDLTILFSKTLYLNLKKKKLYLIILDI